MKTIDRLLHKAKELYAKIMTIIYPDNDDGFIEALGLDPEEFQKTLPSGEVVYEYEMIDLLNRITPELWADYEEEE